MRYTSSCEICEKKHGRLCKSASLLAEHLHARLVMMPAACLVTRLACVTGCIQSVQGTAKASF